MNKKLLFTLALSLGLGSLYAQSNLNLAAHYKLNNNTADATGHGFNGKPTNITYTTDRFGNANSAAVFNGSSSYIATSLKQTTDTAYAVSVWIKSTVTNAAATIIDHRGVYGGVSSNKSFMLGTTAWNPYKFRFAVVNDNFERGFMDGTPTLNVNAFDGTWHHVVAVWSGSPNSTLANSQFKVYFDGNLYSEGNYAWQGSTAISPLTGADSLYIGYGRAEASRFKGALDDIRIYKRNLSAQDVTDLFNEKAPVDNNCLKADYKFNGDASDAGPNSKNGTAYGVSSTTDRNGVANSAYNFSGTNSYVATPLRQESDTAITILLWVKTTQKNNAGTWVDFRGPYGYNSASRGVTLGNLPYSPYNLKFVMNNDDLEIGVSNTNSVVADGNWHHVAAVWSSPSGISISKDQFAIYVDGEKQTSTLDLGHNPNSYTSVSPLTGADSLRIGYGKAWNTYFNGSLDDVRIYGCKYSAADILNDYNNTKSVTTAVIDNSIFNNTALSIYPNPNTGLFTIKNLTENLDIVIVNTLGQIVFSKTVTSSEVNVKLEKGIYIIKSTSGSQTLSEKLVIE